MAEAYIAWNIGGLSSLFIHEGSVVIQEKQQVIASPSGILTGELINNKIMLPRVIGH